MIVFLQGLPGSGKSYEAVVTQIIPALKNGRQVDAYIEGLDFARIAEAAELPVDRVQDLLQPITREQVEVIYKAARKNALIVIDEAQNFWPTGRQKLSPEITQFITEHRHLGQDIILMGQVMGDVHKLWRGRVDQRNSYQKLDAVGLEKRYAITVEKATSPERFQVITKTNNKYDEKYFGTYASHVDSSVNTLNFKDPRASVRNAFWFKWGVPLTIGLSTWGAYQAWGFFHAKPVEHPVAVVAKPAPAAAPASAPSPIKLKSYVARLSDKYRPRLGWMFVTASGVPVGVLEWYDGETVRERLTFDQVLQLGENLVFIGNTMAMIGDTMFTRWPNEQAVQHASVGAQVIPLSAIPAAGP